MSTASRSFFAANGLIFLTLAVGLLNNVLIAAFFGLTARVDAFFAATVLPALFMSLCVDYLGKNFLPVFALARQEGIRVASEMTSNVVLAVFVLALLVTALFLVFGEALFALLLPGFDESGLGLVNDFFTIMAPSMALMAATTFHEYLCQYDERYVTVVRIRMCLPIANSVAIAALAPVVGEYCLPIGYTAGHLLVFLLMARAAGYRFRPRLRFRAHLERKVFANSAIVMSTGLIARSKSLFVNYFASMLGSGVISAIALATKLAEPAQRGAFYAARMVMFSRTARLFRDGDLGSVVALYEFGIRSSFLVLTPVLWWAGLHADTIVALIFGHGAFTDAMAGLVGAVLLALLPAVLFLGVNQLLSNAFYAMDRIKVPAVVMPIGTLLYAAAAGPVSARLGPPGLTLTTTLVSIALFVVLIGMLARALPGLRAGRLLWRILGYSLCAGFWMAGAVRVAEALGAGELASAVFSLPAGLLLYGASLHLLRDGTLQRILTAGRSLFEGGATA